MKRKFVSAVLVLAMIMSMSAIAMAAEPPEPTEPTLPTKPATPDRPPNIGEAGIAYIEGEVVIIDPDNPDIPGGTGWNFVTSKDIDFGKHDLSQNVIEQKYASWMEHRYKDTDYVGINIRNGTLDSIVVTVEISGFQVTVEGEKEDTLQGFILNLVKEGFKTRVVDEGENKANITNPNKKVISDPDRATANSSNKDEFDNARDHKEGQLIAGGKAPILFLPELSVNSAAWGGILTVPQNTVSGIGEAQAVMTWSIDRIPAPVNP